LLGVGHGSVAGSVRRARAHDDRSSTRGHVAGRTPADLERVSEQLRRLPWTSNRIAAELGLTSSTAWAVLARLGLNRLYRLEPPEPPSRSSRRHLASWSHVD
jgi:hypothetical protein